MRPIERMATTEAETCLTPNNGWISREGIIDILGINKISNPREAGRLAGNVRRIFRETVSWMQRVPLIEDTSPYKLIKKVTAADGYAHEDTIFIHFDVFAYINSHRRKIRRDGSLTITKKVSDEILSPTIEYLQEAMTQPNEPELTTQAIEVAALAAPLALGQLVEPPAPGA